MLLSLRISRLLTGRWALVITRRFILVKEF